MSNKKPTSEKQESQSPNYVIIMWVLLTIFVISVSLFLVLLTNNFINMGIFLKNINLTNIGIGNISSSLAASKDFLFNLILVIFAFFVLVIMYMLFRWVSMSEGYVIQPFEVCGCEKDYSGIAISQLLIKELLRIKKIHKNHEESRYILPKTKDLPDPEIPGQGYELLDAIVPSGQDIGYNIANLGTAGQGSISISIGQLLLVLKRLIKSSKVIIGSLQRYGANVSLVAWMGHEIPTSWESNGKIGYLKVERRYKEMDEAEAINNIVKNLAFMISNDIIKIKESDKKGVSKIWKDFKHFVNLNTWLYHEVVKNLAFIIFKNNNDKQKENSKMVIAKTWEGHKFYTEAINGYYLYKTVGYSKCLNAAGENCLNAMKAETIFKAPTCLIYTIGIEYLILQNEDAYKKAKEFLKKAIKLSQGDYRLLLALGTTLAYLKEYDKALSCYDKIIELKPYDKNICRNVWKNKGKVFSKQKDKWDKALECYDKALSLDPNDVYVLNGRGNLFSKQKDKWDKALECYDKALSLDPNDLYTWNNRGNLFSKQKDKWDKALECYDKALSLDPNDVYVLNGRGNLFSKQKDKWDKALKCYNKALELNSNDLYTWYNRGNLFSKQKDKWDKALKCYNKALELNSNDLYTWYNMGNLFSKQEKYDNALECYNKALSLDPNDVYTWNNTGNLFSKQKDKWDKALKCYNKSLDLSPKNVYTWNKIGDLFFEQGKYNKSLKCYNESLRLDPKNSCAQNGKRECSFKLKNC